MAQQAASLAGVHVKNYTKLPFQYKNWKPETNTEIQQEELEEK